MWKHQHNVDMEPVGTLLYRAGTVMAELPEVSRENGGSNDSFGSHCRSFAASCAVSVELM